MVDPVLIVTSVLFAILVMIGAIYFVVYFQHPNDKWQAWFPKIIVVFSLSLAAWNIFLLPLDVANQRGLTGLNAGGIPMSLITLIFYATSIILVLVVMPFTVFFYEGEDAKDDEDGNFRGATGQFGYAIKWIIPTLAIAAGIVMGMYFGGLGYAEIPTVVLQSPLFETTDLDLNSNAPYYTFQFYCNRTMLGKSIPYVKNTPLRVNETNPVYIPTAVLNTDQSGYCSKLSPAPLCCRVEGTNSVVISIGVFIIGVVTFVGWAIFAAFAGVGMAALPYDLVSEFKHRPRPITAQEYQEKKKKIGEQSKILNEVAKTLHQDLKLAARGNSFNRKYRLLKQKEKQFCKDVIILEYHWRRLEECYRFQGGNILLQYAKFAFGLISSILTILWLIHIGVYLIPIMLQLNGRDVVPLLPFLNDMLIMTQGFPFVGILLYGLFSTYMLMCVIKGNQKLGMRLVFFTIHPLVMGETLMSAMVFNAGLVLLCSLPLAQFCTLSFSTYAQYTSNQSIFGVQISSIRGLHFGSDIFLYVMIGFCILTFFYNIYNPFRKQRENQLNFKW